LPDIVDPKIRSRMMSGIRGKNTKPELIVRKALYARGFRYRLHDRNVPGKPDMALPKWNAVIFVNGCFWHGHDCHLHKVPSTRTVFWKEKIERNRQRDFIVRKVLRDTGWRVLTIWECALRGRQKIGLDEVIDRVVSWLCSEAGCTELRGAA
jgi:DNA mismatch endonuclease (patch repair protein)